MEIRTFNSGALSIVYVDGNCYEAILWDSDDNVEGSFIGSMRDCIAWCAQYSAEASDLNNGIKK